MINRTTEKCNMGDSRSFGGFGKSNGNKTILFDCCSQPFAKPTFSHNQVITKPLKKCYITCRNFLKTSHKYITYQTIQSPSLEASKATTTKLVTGLHRISKCENHLTTSHEEDYSLAECQQFILQWAEELSKLPMTSVEPNKSSPSKLQSACWEEYEVEKRTCPKEAERRLAEAQGVVSNWAAQLQLPPQDSVCRRQDVCSVLQDLERQWKRGTLPSMLSAMDFLIWAVLKDQPDEGSIPQLWLKSKQRFKHTASITVIPGPLWDWIGKAAVDILLDPESAHPDFLISKDQKRLKVGKPEESRHDPRHKYGCRGNKYNGWWCTLGTEGFTTGRHYWEVGVEGKMDWRIGVARESAPRNGFINLNTTTGYWTLRMQVDGLKALKVPAVDIRNPGRLGRIGVYLDIEQGQLSFYDAVRRSHIYTFNDTFSEKVYPVFGTVETDRELIIV
ncbi:nuclear factor 7, brain-like [Esox lucius]|uniref:B30.2/SPRY domain-containing protein n=2 Tax=Esox lucius TaxID=8010 RepID=A0A3P8YD70_ESOLU|nr:nuclear factor 7, brain-like [Esox lucius]